MMPTATPTPLPRALERSEALQKIADYFRPQLLEQVKSEKLSAWAARNFYIPETDRPIALLPHQVSILNYVFDPNNPYQYGGTIIYSTIKKSGKTAVAAMVGRWIAETWGRSNEVYAVANDQEQARGRIYQKIIDSIQMQAKNEAFEAKTLNIGWKIIERQAEYTNNGSIVRALSSDYRGEAGSNPTATLWTELWGYTSEASRRLWEELTPVPTRRRSVRYVETYAGYEDESDLLISLYNLGLEGRQLTHDDIDWPFSDRPPIWINERANVFMYWDTGPAARRMPWQDDAYYAKQEATLRPAAFERLHNNYWTTSTESFLPVEWWSANRTMVPALPSDTPVVMSVDASVSSDCTGITIVSRNPAKDTDPMLRDYRVWYPPKGGTINLADVETFIRDFCSAHNVVQMTYDAYQLHKMATDLRQDGIVWAKPFSQSAQREIADYQLYTLIRDRRMPHNAGTEFEEHIRHAAAKTNKNEDNRLRIVKKAAAMKIDLVVCLSMATFETLRLNLAGL